ncbi:MAG: hypothetical protein M3042_12105 [Actinomycetota bacterium]|nr:hypothetical protein [Actinomycetota bacterium]
MDDHAVKMLADWRCWHCDAGVKVLPAAGERAVLDVQHLAGCPDREDDEDEAVVYEFDHDAEVLQRPGES